MALYQEDSETVIGRIGRRGAGERQSPLPSIDDLAARIRFCPKVGRIWLGDSRMVLMHVRSLGALRNELIETLGMQGARALLTRMGYASGAQDAELAIKVRGNGACDFFDFFTVGPQLHMIEGIVTVEPLRIEQDAKTGHFYGELLWHDSSEDEVHIASHGIGTEPACWMQIGYASGYTSVIMGRPILFREVECRAMGHTACRIIGKPVSQWTDAGADDDIRYLQPHAFANKADLRRPLELMPDAAPIPGARPGSAHKALVGASAGFNVVCHMIEKVARTNATTLLLGESGVGKEMFAQTLHRISARASGPFVAVNCAAIPDSLIESELFGVERGAFTGAVASRPGRFERACGGTLFLDEIGTLGLSAQGKLLRALQEGEIERVGDTRSRTVDVRLVAATNVDLRELVAKGLFREDLFYRLNVFPIQIPPLRDRRADIPILLDHFLPHFAARHGRSVTGFTQRAITGLYAYNWPGNVRELENMVERGVILAPSEGLIDLCHLFTSGERIDPYVMEMSADGRLNDMAPKGAVGDMVEAVLETRTSFDELEECLLRSAVERAGGNLAEAARALGLSRAQLAYRMKKFSDDELAAGL